MWVKKHMHLWELGGNLSKQSEDKCKYYKRVVTPVTPKSVSILNLNSELNLKQN